jgi:hypothetical protein
MNKKQERLINYAKEFLKTNSETSSVFGESIYCVRVNENTCIAVDSENNLAYKINKNGNIELIDTNEEQFSNYKVTIPTEETARVVVDYVFYTDTKEEAEEILKAYEKGEGYKVKGPDVINTVDFLDSWNTEMFPEDGIIEKIN